MTVPSDPPASVTPAAFKTWAQNVSDTAQDHETRVDALESATYAPVVRRFRSGHYYYVDYAVRTVGAPGDSTLRLAPFIVGQTATFDRIRIAVTTAGAAGSVHRLGLYTSAADGTPADLIVDAGTVDTASTGNKEATISETLTPGLYWVASVQQGAPATPATIRIVQESTLVPGATGTNPAAGWFESGVSGALPATYTAYVESGFSPFASLRVA